MGLRAMPKHRRRGRKTAPLLLLALLLLIAGIAAILTPVLTTELEMRHDAAEYAQLKAQAIEAPTKRPLQEMATEPAGPDRIPEMTISLQDAVPAPITDKTGGAGVDVLACQAENADFIAWIQIPGTPVDYPVVLSDETEYYLNHTFSGKKSYLGTLFSLGHTDYRTPGRNIGIYGHHIRSKKDVMFSPLLAYKDRGFYAGHETIYLDSLYHSDAYTIFAVINMESGDWDPSATRFASDDDFLRFLRRAKSLSLYETGVEVTANDKILTLITCDRDFIPKYGRLVVMAKRQEND